MNTLLKILLVSFITIFLYSCGEDTIVTTSSGPFALSGTIQNWTLGGNIKLRAEIYDTNFFLVRVLDSNFVSINGEFNLKPKNPPDSLLFPITYLFQPRDSCTISVEVNPPDAKGNELALDLYNDSMQIGWIYRSNDTTYPTTGRFWTYYAYLNKSVRITGSIICNSSPFHDTTIYNFSGIKGWNKVVEFVNSWTDSTSKVTYSNTEPAGGKWWAHIRQGNDLSSKSRFSGRMFGKNNCSTCR